MSEFKDCPFCGEQPKKYFIELDQVVCDCGTIQGDVFKDQYPNKFEWNTRPIEDKLNARIAELEEILEGKEKLHAASAQAALDHINYSVSKIVYDRVKAEAVKLNEVVSIQASRIDELERQLFFLRRELERHEQK